LRVDEAEAFFGRATQRTLGKSIVHRRLRSGKRNEGFAFN
jgi:hypothetical protein